MKKTKPLNQTTRWLALLFLSFFYTLQLFSQTVTSTTSGGKWNTPATWVGGVVPSSSNSVTIDGPVALDGDFTCSSLTINSVGSIQNQYGYSPTFTINGKITNNGSLIKNPGGYSLYLNLLGDIENNGTWAPDRTTFSGTGDQRIKESSGKSIQGYVVTTDSIGGIILDSDVLFSGNIWDMSKCKITTNGFNLRTQDYILNNGRIVSNESLVLKNTAIASMTLSGNYKLDGKVRVRGDNVLNGTVTVLDTLFNEYGYSPTLTVNAKIINNGKIIKHPSGYSLYLNIFSDIENNGIWAPNQTTLAGTSDQNLKQSTGKSFQGYFLTTDSIGQIVLGSDVTFNSLTWDWNKSKLRTNGFNLTALNCQLNNGTVISNDKLILKNTGIASMILTGNYKLDGRIRVRGDNVFNGTATILDTLNNDYGYSPTLKINGNIVNNGTIIHHPNGYSLYLEMLSNIENNGKWEPSQTTLTGNSDQNLKQAVGKSFQGYFLTSDSIGQIVLGSDVTFENNQWDWNKSKLLTNGFNLTAKNCILNNGRISSNDKLIFKSTAIASMNLSGNYKLDGRVRVRGDNVLNGTVTVLDTLNNEYGYSPTLKVNAKIINNGTIISHPSGYSFYLTIYSDIENNGKWAPTQTIFSGENNQRLKQTANKSFQGYVLSTDSIGDIILDSDILFDSNTWDMNKCQVQTNKFNFFTRNYILSNGKIMSNDTLYLRGSRISSMIFNGDYKLGGQIGIQEGNIFNGTATVLDTLYNQYGYSPTPTFAGNLVNNGTISNHPSGYSLRFILKGDLVNNNKINVTAVYLTGTADKNISGRSGAGLTGTIYADDAISLSGNNVLPNINFTGNPASACIVKPGATLSLLSFPNSSKLKNYGRISVFQDIDNNASNTYNFYAASLSSKAKTPVNRIAIDHYGYQQHPTAKGTINSWWRLRNTPQLFNDTLNWLKLSYSDDALNGNPEDSIKVFHSPNAGMSWKRIKKGYAIDKVNNIVTINQAPSYGHYLLSSSALGITSFQALVETAEPRFGGNTGQLTMYLFGAGFKNTTNVKLHLAGQPDIAADSTWTTDLLGESMLAQFDLKNKPLGVYDLMIETPGETTLTLPAHFTIQKGERSNPWSNLSGRDRFLINRWQTFNISYGNTANTDALGTILVYVVSDLPELEVEFPDINVVLPKGIIDLGPDFTRFRDLGLYYVSDTLSGYEGQRMRIYPFYIPYIAAGSSNTVRVRVKLSGNGSLKMDSWILDPLFEKIDYNLKSAEPMPSEVRACITAAAMHAWYNGALSLAEGTIPGVACWGVIDKVVDPIGYITPEELKPEKKDTWGSWFWSGVSIMGSAVQCGASFVPVVGQAVNLGIGLVNMGIDMKDGYDANQGCWEKFRKKSQGKLNSRGVTSFDPNEKVGPQGFTSEHYISKEGNLNYTIYFENKASAGASALEVFVTDTLDVTKFDLSTFSFNAIAFADTAVKIQEYAKEFQVLVDMYPKKDIIVQVHGKLDSETGVVSWDFHSLDRITMELTEDPDLGFLAPNVTSPEGEGNVTFSCKLKSSVVHDDLISNRASIVFDFNSPILTNIFTNRIDDRVPESSVAPLNLTQTDSIFTVSWTGNDLGSKISRIHIFVSTNNEEYILWKIAPKADEAKFTGKNGNTYKFYSLATDSIGFMETRKLNADASTTMDIKTGNRNLEANANDIQVFPNPANHSCMVSFNFNSSSEISISLVDISGKSIRTIARQRYQPDKQNIEIDLNGVADGLYFVKLTNNSKSYFQKLIVKN
ncbi:MAG: T9SS type A sorting domain-containing protein [Prolixibacteraceae bacterium]